jgi:hypothetical protein
MHKRICLQFLLLNIFILPIVPADVSAAFDAPESDPLQFATAGQITFPDFGITADATTASPFFAAGAAQLYGMPEIKPFFLRAGVRLWGGRGQVKANGLTSGAYRELKSSLSYGKAWLKSFWSEFELEILEVAIKDYGNAWSQQANARFFWDAADDITVAFTWINLSQSRLGAEHYPLPQRIAAGIAFSPVKSLQLLIEMEQDPRYSPSSRIALAYFPLSDVALLAGFQNDPNLLSAGICGTIHRFQATLAFQYHPDLGYSQCIGIRAGF